jgi:hypothetical protein
LFLFLLVTLADFFLFCLFDLEMKNFKGLVYL